MAKRERRTRQPGTPHDPATAEEVLMALNECTSAAFASAAPIPFGEAAEEYLLERYDGAFTAKLPKHAWKGKLRTNVLRVAAHFGKVAGELAVFDNTVEITLQQAKLTAVLVEAHCTLAEVRAKAEAERLKPQGVRDASALGPPFFGFICTDLPRPI